MMLSLSTVMTWLTELGVKISLDDFGTGYSSLAYLKRFPLSRIKIDKSFVHDIIDDPEDAAIVNAVVILGKSLNMTVTAEGVEDAAQREFLRKIGCDEYQGFLFSRPVPADALAELLQSAPKRRNDRE